MPILYISKRFYSERFKTLMNQISNYFDHFEYIGSWESLDLYKVYNNQFKNEDLYLTFEVNSIIDKFGKENFTFKIKEVENI